MIILLENCWSSYLPSIEHMYFLIDFLSWWLLEGDHDRLNNLIWLITLIFNISNLAPHQIRNYLQIVRVEIRSYTPNTFNNKMLIKIHFKWKDKITLIIGMSMGGAGMDNNFLLPFLLDKYLPCTCPHVQCDVM